MKKILFATTALVATAGVAAADVDVTGSAEIGIVGGDRYATSGTVNKDGVTQFWTDVEVVFTMTGEADNGLTFGAKIDLDEAANGNGTDDGGATWFIAFGNARLDMGDTDGALDWAMQEVNLVGGSIDDAETEHVGFNGNSGFDGNEDGQVARFTYTFGDFAVALSAELDDDPDAFLTGSAAAANAGFDAEPGFTFSGTGYVANSADDDNIFGIGFTYSGEFGGITLGVGVGYQTQNDNGDMYGVSVDAGFANGLVVGVNYSEMDPEMAGVANTTHWGLGVGYTTGNIGIGVNYGEYDRPGSKDSGFGLAATYDLGGGLVAQFGYGAGTVDSKTAGVADVDSDNFSLGLAMSF